MAVNLGHCIFNTTNLLGSFELKDVNDLEIMIFVLYTHHQPNWSEKIKTTIVSYQNEIKQSKQLLRLKS